MAEFQFQIHDDGVVSFNGEDIGKLVTGEDGGAYVEFNDGYQPPSGYLWFCGPNPAFCPAP